MAVMMISVAEEKVLRTEERIEVLMEFQVVVGTGFCLRGLQALCMNVKAEITLERLWLRSRRLILRLEDRLVGIAAWRLMVLEGRSCRGRDVHILIGQED